jgi:hypothetical protein
MIRWLVSLLLTVGLSVAPGEGTRPGVIAIYESGRGVQGVMVRIWADDRGRALSAMGAGHGGMGFLTLDNVGYVLDQDQQGSVGRQEDLLAWVVAGRQGVGNRGVIERLTRQRVEIVPAGTARIAGFTGDVYRIALIEGETRSPPFEIIISADPQLAPVGRELLRFYDSLRAPIVATVGSPPQPYLAVRALLARGTPLAFGGMRLQSVERRALTDAQTALPGPVLSREALTDLLMAGPMGADPAQQDMPETENLADFAENTGSYDAYGDGNELPDNAIDDPANDTYPD